jgi:hypothetical protein
MMKFILSRVLRVLCAELFVFGGSFFAAEAAPTGWVWRQYLFTSHYSPFFSVPGSRQGLW